MYVIQSILFDKNYWSKEKSKKWLNRKKLKPIKKPHETIRFIRYRIREPKDYYDFKFVNLTKTIKVIVAKKKS
jgi:hypothetical protein